MKIYKIDRKIKTSVIDTEKVIDSVLFDFYLYKTIKRFVYVN